MKNLSIIVAIGENNAIGKDGDLLWHIREDMLYFKRTTKNHPVLMGRKTWDSLQVQPLPKRHNIIVSSNPNFVFEHEQVSILHSIEQAKELNLDDEIFVIGGGTIYKEFLPLADRLYITKVFKAYPDADTFFPDIDWQEWKTIYQSERQKDNTSNIEFQFFVFERK